MDRMSDAGVVIVGAGLAGLSCAIELERAGFTCTVIERDHRVGGRVQTDVVDGFRLGRGLYVCGDHRADGSINGAMASGRDAAAAVIADLGGSAP